MAFSLLLRSLHCCLFVAIILPFAPSCGPCPLYFIYSPSLRGTHPDRRPQVLITFYSNRLLSSNKSRCASAAPLCARASFSGLLLGRMLTRFFEVEKLEERCTCLKQTANRRPPLYHQGEASKYLIFAGQPNWFDDYRTISKIKGQKVK